MIGGYSGFTVSAPTISVGICPQPGHRDRSRSSAVRADPTAGSCSVTADPLSAARAPARRARHRWPVALAGRNPLWRRRRGGHQGSWTDGCVQVAGWRCPTACMAPAIHAESVASIEGPNWQGRGRRSGFDGGAGDRCRAPCRAAGAAAVQLPLAGRGQRWPRVGEAAICELGERDPVGRTLVALVTDSQAAGEEVTAGWRRHAGQGRRAESNTRAQRGRSRRHSPRH